MDIDIDRYIVSERKRLIRLESGGAFVCLQEPEYQGEMSERVVWTVQFIGCPEMIEDCEIEGGKKGY